MFLYHGMTNCLYFRNFAWLKLSVRKRQAISCTVNLDTNLFLLQVIFAIIDFVSSKLGSQFVESPPIKLSTLYEDTSNTIPLIFVLSPGSDPMSSFLRFAKEKDYMERFVIN